MTITVAVIVPTFNRPRMLREALASVVAGRPDQVIVVDDGSTYDMYGMYLREFIQPSRMDIQFQSILARPMTVEERMSTPRQGSLINKALQKVTCDVVTYLCDDDLHAPGWYDALRAVWAREPERELVRGDWLWFTDGETPREDCPPVPLDGRQMTAGNFAHHASLTRDRGARWPEEQMNCLDDGFLRSLNLAGVAVVGVPSVGFAGWRREHPYINGLHSNGKTHTESFRAVLERGYLE